MHTAKVSTGWQNVSADDIEGEFHSSPEPQRTNLKVHVNPINHRDVIKISNASEILAGEAF